MEYVNGKLTYTLEQELRIYKKAFEIHKEDIKYAKRYNIVLDGMCTNIADAIYDLFYIDIDYKDLPERFLALKPKKKWLYAHWWSQKHTNRTRWNKYIYLITDTEREIKESNGLCIV